MFVLIPKVTVHPSRALTDPQGYARSIASADAPNSDTPQAIAYLHVCLQVGSSTGRALSLRYGAVKTVYSDLTPRQKGLVGANTEGVGCG